MLKTTMIGCVGQNAELKEINGNVYVCFDLAHSVKVKGEKRTTWVRVRKIDKEQILAQYITKGKAIYVEGNPIVGAYINKDGNPVADLTIWADKIEFIAGSNNSENIVKVATQSQQFQVNNQTENIAQKTEELRKEVAIEMLNPMDIDLPF